MAIRIDPSAPNSAVAEYIHTKKTFDLVKSFENAPIICCFGDCLQSLPVFADLANQTISRNNDLSKFIFEPPTGSVVTFTLTNQDTGTDYIITDSTYGAFADIGDITQRPLVWGFVLNWFKVANLISFGNYRINVTIVNSSDTEIFNDNTPCYNLRPFTCESAHGTIRFDVTQEGYIQDGFDWRTMTGLAGFFKPQQIRVYGSMDKNPITTTDNITDSNRNSIQVQTSIHHEYEITVLYLQGTTYDLFFKSLLLENPITVNSYSVFDSSVIENIKCSYVSADKNPKDPRSKEEIAVITLEDYTKATVKRH